MLTSALKSSKGDNKMLRNIQVKIVLIFLVIGIIVIGAMGYTNYKNVQKVTEAVEIGGETSSIVLQKYQENLKLVTIGAICIFALICILARYFCYQKNYFSNFEIN